MKKIFFIILYLIFSMISLIAQQKNNVLKLSLDQVINMALRNSKNLKDYHLSNELNKANLRYAERKFEPSFTVGSTSNLEHDYTKNGNLFDRTNSTIFGLTAGASMLLPTGATISYNWQGGYYSETYNQFQSGKSSADYLSQGGDLLVSQPLLKGGGFRINEASIKNATLTDSINYQTLISSTNNTIASIIYSYRNIILDKKMVDIAEYSLQLSKELMVMNKALVKTGIIAETDLIQNKSQITGAEYQLLQAKNDLKNAKLNLSNLLGINLRYKIVPTDSIMDYNENIDSVKMISTAMKSNPDFLVSKYNLESAEIDSMLAENNDKIALNVYSEYKNSTKSISPYFLNNYLQFGLGLSYTINDRSRDLQDQQAEINVDRAKNNLKLVKSNIETSLINNLSNLRLKKNVIEVARQIRKYAQQKLEVEKEKMKIGKSSTFTLVSFQNELVTAENNEVQSEIDYLNTLTAIHVLMGDIMKKYKISFN